MNIMRFLNVTIFIIAAIIAIAVVAVVVEVFKRQSHRTGEPPNISGTYIFKSENCSKNGCFFGADSKFTIGYLEGLPNFDRVYVTQTSSGITISHAGWKNIPMKMVLLQDDQSLGWNQNEFVYKWVKWDARGGGMGRLSRTLHLFLDDNRSLIIKSKENKSGFFLYFLPFTESMTFQMKLIRADAS